MPLRDCRPSSPPGGCKKRIWPPLHRPAFVLSQRSVVPVVYPAEALERGIEGWVELELVVDRAGQPRDVVVTEASPAGRFDAAALDAVRQYRYVPFERDGRIYERRVRLRVRFELE
jgi:TonB family protein